MRLDKLQIDLRPRPNAQALDLGFALLRSHAGSVYMAWLALWLPLVTVCGIMAYLLPDYATAWMLVAWWLRPMLERAPLYVLSRKVFGEEVTWQDALRAWPRQWRGGWFRLLTWWRPFAAGRGLYQAVWQLEGARGKVATERRNVLGRAGTYRSAAWFGVACAHFEGVLQIGAITFIGIFLSGEHVINPFALYIESTKNQSPLFFILTFGAYAIGGGVIGPIYTACCFTLYLNRRATLEAWDIEIALRQIHPPPARQRPAKALPGLLLALVLMGFCLGPSGDAAAAAATASASVAATAAPLVAAQKCDPPAFWRDPVGEHRPEQSEEQLKLRGDVVRLFDTDDMRGYVCKDTWLYKNRDKTKKVADPPKPTVNFPLLAQFLKIALIAAALGLVAWLLYRYRDAMLGWLPAPPSHAASEIAGLDIRPETLPADVPAAVRALWIKGQHRAALALLYRATLSHLVTQDGLHLGIGATEGDCLRQAGRAHARAQLSAAKLQVATNATQLWLNGAYGKRWPHADAVLASCAAWQAAFGSPASNGNNHGNGMRGVSA